MTLREILHAHIPTLSRKSTLRDAVDKMDVYQFPALVVVDDDHAPIAVLTEGDVCQAVRQRGNVTSLANEPASTFATKDPTTANPDMEVSDALHLMLSSGLTILPVVESDRLSGVVLRIDLMQAMLTDAVKETT
ncbi:MAG TPA: CBS domain-containing protein [Fimbriimonadaceae bacterium]|nr:CBS domain-containing protein [Fimbriimonadaceae bacterium]